MTFCLVGNPGGGVGRVGYSNLKEAQICSKIQISMVGRLVGRKKYFSEKPRFIRENGGPDETRTRDLRRDRPAF